MTKPYVVGHYSQWLGCCSTIQLSCIAVRYLELALRIFVGKLSFNIEVIVLNQTKASQILCFLPTKNIWWCAFLQNPNCLKCKIPGFLGRWKKHVCPSLEESSFHPPSPQKNHQRELNPLSFASARLQKTIQNTKTAPCENVDIFSRSCKPPPKFATLYSSCSAESFAHVLSASQPWKKNLTLMFRRVVCLLETERFFCHLAIWGIGIFDGNKNPAVEYWLVQWPKSF